MPGMGLRTVSWRTVSRAARAQGHRGDLGTSPASQSSPRKRGF